MDAVSKEPARNATSRQPNQAGAQQDDCYGFENRIGKFHGARPMLQIILWMHHWSISPGVEGYAIATLGTTEHPHLANRSWQLSLGVQLSSFAARTRVPPHSVPPLWSLLHLHLEVFYQRTAHPSATKSHRATRAVRLCYYRFERRKLPSGALHTDTRANGMRILARS